MVQPADVLNLHPGAAGEVSVVRWTAAATGVYTIAGIPSPGGSRGIDTGGTTTDISIRHNSTLIWSGNINGYGNQATFSLSATLSAGDTLDFQVGYGSNQTYNSDSTGLAATITQSGGSSPANVKWLLTDQLGTPRMQTMPRRIQPFMPI